MYMLSMEGKFRSMLRVRVYRTHLLPALKKIRKRRFSLKQRQQAIKIAADMCLARTANKDSVWRRSLNFRLNKRKKRMTTLNVKTKALRFRRIYSVTQSRRMKVASLNSRFCNNVDIEIGGDDHGAIDRRLGILRRLIPGGRNTGVDTLFQETADYILNLQTQVRSLEALTEFYTRSSSGFVDESITQKQPG